MTLNNTKSNNRGFTLVELLIVIVVIAILAAISLVAYNGIQDRSRTTANNALATNVAKKAEAANVITGSYPTNASSFPTSGEGKLDNQSQVVGTAPAAPNVDNVVVYKACSTPAGSYQVQWYSHTTSPKAWQAIPLGGAPATVC